jgi:[protein-PII] uridylyltransferase
VVTLVESGQQWILEVRAHDRPGLLHVLARELRDLGVEITAAIVSTLGAEACDAFYIRPASGAWDPDRIRERLLAVLR